MELDTLYSFLLTLFLTLFISWLVVAPFFEKRKTEKNLEMDERS